jgi:hypothetical protein
VASRRTNLTSVVKGAYTFTILLKIHEGYRPSQIAKVLNTTEQALHYHTSRLIQAKVIEKFTDNGLCWRLTQRGAFILKEILTGSVNHNKYKNNITTIPVRLHNVTFSFNIISIDKNLKLRWRTINSGVRKCFVKYPTHTLEITKSPNEGQSVLEIHLPHEYVFDPLKGLLKQYDLARHYASLAAQRLRFVISENGKLVKKPHFAFENDIIALYLATFQTAEMTATKENGKAWIDGSKGNGELETNDIAYAYDYLRMPLLVKDTAKTVAVMSKRITGYHKFHDPLLSENN